MGTFWARVIQYNVVLGSGWIFDSGRRVRRTEDPGIWVHFGHGGFSITLCLAPAGASQFSEFSENFLNRKFLFKFRKFPVARKWLDRTLPHESQARPPTCSRDFWGGPPNLGKLIWRWFSDSIFGSGGFSEKPRIF